MICPKCSATFRAAGALESEWYERHCQRAHSPNRVHHAYERELEGATARPVAAYPGLDAA